MGMLNPKTKKETLEYFLRLRKIPGKLYFVKRYHGWMHNLHNEMLLGSFVQALEMITGGSLDFLKELPKEK